MCNSLLASVEDCVIDHTRAAVGFAGGLHGVGGVWGAFYPPAQCLHTPVDCLCCHTPYACMNTQEARGARLQYLSFVACCKVARSVVPLCSVFIDAAALGSCECGTLVDAGLGFHINCSRLQSNHAELASSARWVVVHALLT